MSITLSGKLADITTAPVEDITRVTVKAPFYRPGPAGQLTTTTPVPVELSATGEFTITVTEGIGWLYIEGDSWSDSVRFVASAGMTKFWEAVLNAMPLPTQMLEYLGIKERFEDMLADAVDAVPTTVRWDKGRVNQATIGTLENAPVGFTEVWSASDAQGLNLPALSNGVLETFKYGNVITQRFTVFTNGEFQTWVTSYNTGSAPVWEKYADPAKLQWLKAKALPYGSADDLPDGIHTVWSALECQTLGIPAAGQGIVHTVRFGNIVQQVAEINEAGTWVVLRRRSQAGVWEPWVSQQRSTGGGGTSAPTAGLKTVPIALTLGGPEGSGYQVPASGSYRIHMLNNAPMLRWRLCASNRNPRMGKSTGTKITLTRVTVGEHAGGGKFKAAPKTVYTNLVIPANGDVVYGAWQKDGLADGVEHLFGYDYTADKTVNGLAGGSWSTTGTASDVAPTLKAEWATPIDLWVEVETYSTTPVIAAFGDSLTCGVGATRAVFDSWLNQYCRGVKALPVHYAASGDLAQHWASDFSAYKWTRWDHTSSPDAVMWALGSNDIGGARTLDELKKDVSACIEHIKSKWAAGVYATTIAPRNTWADVSDDPMRKNYNTWVRTQPWAQDVFDFSAAVLDTVTGGIKPEFNSDGVHLTTGGYAAAAARIQPRIVTPPAGDSEALRAAISQAENAKDVAVFSATETKAAQLSAFSGAFTTGNTPPNGLPEGGLFIDVTTGIIYQK